MCRWYSAHLHQSKIVPTPFYHLSLAEELARHPDLTRMARNILGEQFAAFAFGNTAPDVQTVSGQSRQATHFYDLPIYPHSVPAWENFLGLYPAFTRPDRLSADQAAFLAGYLSHLQADWFWVLEIFAPVFGPDVFWQAPRQGEYLHNVLRIYLDRQILDRLLPETRSSLSRLMPGDWLPFVSQVHLHAWLDFLAGQLQPGARIQSVEVFAARQGISPGIYYQLLNSESGLETEIFGRLSRSGLETYRSHLLVENVRMLNQYLR